MLSKSTAVAVIRFLFTVLYSDIAQQNSLRRLFSLIRETSSTKRSVSRNTCYGHVNGPLSYFLGCRQVQERPNVFIPFSQRLPFLLVVGVSIINQRDLVSSSVHRDMVQYVADHYLWNPFRCHTCTTGPSQVMDRERRHP